jgi:thiosulfate reductase cytochrome b subunit
MLGVLRVIYFFMRLIRFVQVFFFCVFVFLAGLIYFLALVLFSSQTRIFGLIYGRTKDFGSTQSSQPSRIKSIESKKSESKGL